MDNNSIQLTQLRNNIDFASAAQFFHTFQSAFRPWPSTIQDDSYAHPVNPNDYVFETEDLERLLLEVSERSRFEELLVKMLRLTSHNRFINLTNWQSYFSKEFDKREFEETNPFISEQQSEQVEGQQVLVNFFTLPLDTRVHLLHLLCEWQLDEPERFREHLDSEEDSVQWRVDPIGYDKRGATFWLFDDNRLYKETPKPAPVKKTTNKRKRRTVTPARKSSRRSTRSTDTKEEPVEEEEEEVGSEEEGEWVPWKLVCLTRFDWEQFPTKYKDSKNTDEQRFYRLLTEDLLPKVIPVLEEHEKEVLKQQAMIHRKRSSRIMIRELEALERSSAEPEGAYSPIYNGIGSRTSSRIERKALEREQHEKEQQAKAREERLMERERRLMEREYRAIAREKRQEPQDPPEEHVIQAEKKEEVRPKRKYVKKPKFDEFGNPIPRKVKLDKDGNPIPLKKRGRKPKNKDLDEEDWMFDCICGVNGKNVDDGEPMIACEKCGVWQHIACLQKSGIIEKDKSLDSLEFVCQRCDDGKNEEEFADDEPTGTGFRYFIETRLPETHNQVSHVPVKLPPIQSTWQHQPSSVRDNLEASPSFIPYSPQSSNNPSQPVNTSQPLISKPNLHGLSSMGNTTLQSILNQERISPVIPQSSIRSVPPDHTTSIRSEPSTQEPLVRTSNGSHN